MKTTLCVLALAALVTGCGGSQPRPEVASPAPVIKVPERAPYTIGIGDKIEIKFPYYPGYSAFLVVRPDGAITVPEVGEIIVEGMTPLEVQAIIKARFAQIVAEPEVSVIVAEASGQKIFVFGEVKMAGAQDLKGTMTLLDAVATAGGATYMAKQDEVVLIRRSPDGVFAGSKHNLEKIIEGRAENPYLMARDVVYVPISSIGKVNVFVDQFFTQLSPFWYFLIAGKEVINPEGTYIIGR